MIHNELTIIISTKDRLNFIGRCLEFFLIEKISHKILIVDASNQKIHEKLKNLILRYSDLNIKLFFKSGSCEEGQYFGLQNCDTEFACLMADDDMYMLGEINFKELSKKFLNNYSAITGRGVMMSNVDMVYSKNAAYDLYDNVFATENENSKSRCLDFLKSQKSLSFTIVKTKLFLELYQYIVKLPKYHQSIFFGEILIGIALTTHGKVFFYNDVFFIRQSHKNTHWANIDYNKLFKKEDVDKSIVIVKEYLQNFYDHTDDVNDILTAILKTFEKLKLKEKIINKNNNLNILVKVSKIFFRNFYLKEIYYSFILLFKNRKIKKYNKIIKG